MQTNNTLENLIESLKCLPGVGPKSALRLAYYLLQRDRKGALKLASSIEESLNKLGHCKLCNNFSEKEVCSICASPNRISDTLCVVEMPTDLLMLEQTRSYKVCNDRAYLGTLQLSSLVYARPSCLFEVNNRLI